MQGLQIKKNEIYYKVCVEITVHLKVWQMPAVKCTGLQLVKIHRSVMNKNNNFKQEEYIMGKIFKFHQDVDTDQIIASQYLLYPTIDEMKVHTFESLDKEFASKVKTGDYVVASENFGCGSSREQAPAVLKALGVKAVVAKSFARIFYRNAINIGLPVIVCKDLYDGVETGEEMELFLTDGLVKTGDKEYVCTKLPPYMQGILEQGGLIASLDKED